MRKLIVRVLPLLPRVLRTLVARRLLGWEIHPTARLGRSLVDVRHVRLGPGASIGPRNTFRGLEELVLERGASIGGENRVVGFPDGTSPFPGDPPRRSVLTLGEYAAITTGHWIDCCDSVRLEHHAALFGFGSVVLTHSLRPRRNDWKVAPLTLGHHAAVMSGCTVFVGADIAPQAVVSAGSVVESPLTKPSTLYRGNPAVAVRELDDSYQLLNRPGEYGVGGAPA